ncbi:Plasma membrane H+-transporting ATPase [Ceratobasidium theobromae]|uniref:Plasma membrane H+-transporting ATPase n=1 Tax=Ceratobasidium theobromae TaxID=1582974 RepID=A0A5N5Q7G5_9AGAM|nr:Plasma membrane H+-transporting ATPase [Ceratobasidium theobromae]
MEVDNGAIQEAVIPEEAFVSGNDKDEGEGENVDAMDISFRAPASLRAQEATSEDDELLVQELSIISLGLDKDTEPDAVSSSLAGPILPPDLSMSAFHSLDTSTPAPTRLRPHPFSPSAPPRRQISRLPTITGGRRSLGDPGRPPVPKPTAAPSHKHPHQ